MANRIKTDYLSDKETEYLLNNINAMKERFQGEPFHGEGLSQLRRKVTGREKSDLLFQKRLKETQPLLFEIVSGNTLKSHVQIYHVESGKKKANRGFAEDIAAFCTKAFAFDETVTPEDVVTKDLSPFPPLRRINERWKRYVGTYRCFYPYQSERGLELRGGLLDLKEEEGHLRCRLITGIRKDERFEDILGFIKLPIEHFMKRLEQYSKTLSSHEARLACYEGSADVSIDGYLFLKAPRVDNQNVALILLRRFDTSSQPHYSGCIAAVTLCRKDDVVTYPMTVSLPEFSMKQEKELLLRYLKDSIHGEAGLSLSADRDKKWNQSVMDWCFWQEENDESD